MQCAVFVQIARSLNMCIHNVWLSLSHFFPVSLSLARSRLSISTRCAHCVCNCQQRLLQRPTSTRMPIQTKSTTSTSAISTSPRTTSASTPNLEIYTLSKNKNENNGPTSTFDDLLNSFQKEPTTTTRRPQLTTFSDADDIAFLKGLVRIKSVPLFHIRLLNFCSIFFFYPSLYFYLYRFSSFNRTVCHFVAFLHQALLLSYFQIGLQTANSMEQDSKIGVHSFIFLLIYALILSLCVSTASNCD